MKIGVLGAGKFGLAIANQLSFNAKNHVVVISKSSKKIESINFHQTVDFYSSKLSKKLKATNDIIESENKLKEVSKAATEKAKKNKAKLDKANGK